MPYGRQMRLDRRRRVLRDNIIRNAPEMPTSKTSRTARPERPAGETSTSVVLAGYSQEVRGPCQQRLVHFIPVRPASLAMVVTGILASVGMLIGLHYAVWIAGPDSWRSTPLSLLLDVRSRVGLAGWINVQLWLVTAILCGMTFQIRKHRLDDYRAHYRIWLWLAFASLLASVEAGTGLTQVLAATMEKFGRINFGWSGRTLVEVILATSVGLLSLKICTELRGSVISQFLWLAGLVCWIPSALLASQLIKTTLRPDYVHLYIGAFWLFGKTLVMLSSLIYLRQVYIAAQRRFVERTRLVEVPWKNNWLRLRHVGNQLEVDEEVLPVEKKESKRKSVASRSNEETEVDATDDNTGTKRRLSLPKVPWNRLKGFIPSRFPTLPLPQISQPSLTRKKKADSGAPESNADQRSTSTASATENTNRTVAKSKRRLSIPKPKLPSISGLWKWIKLPKLSSLNPISRLRLTPPTDDSIDHSTETSSTTNGKTNRASGAPIPSTAPSTRPPAPSTQSRSTTSSTAALDDDEGDDDSDGYDDYQDRKLSKAERKKLKRQQQEQRRNVA